MGNRLARSLGLAALVAVSSTCFGQATPLGRPTTTKPPAEEIEPCVPDAQGKVHPACTPANRVRPHEPMYGLVQKAKGDDRALRLHYSLRYVFLVPDCRARYDHALKKGKAAAKEAFNDCVGEIERERDEIYAMYTGEFDFYMGTRPSGPVINRISNPGLHWRNYRGDGSGSGLKWVDVGVEHRSNGQTTDPRARGTRLQFRAEEEFRAGNRAYIDSISQDTNYFVLEAKYNAALPGEDAREPDPRLQLWARWKPFYFSSDTQITWGPKAAENPPVSDYDRFRFSVAYRLWGKTRLYADWTVGDKLFRTDSLNVGFHFPWQITDDFVLPLYLRAHFGPLYTLADFTHSERAFGIGILLLSDH